MRGIVIRPDGGASEQDFPEPLYQTAGAVVGGRLEVVHPMGLPKPFVMIVNEEGRMKDLPYNSIGSFWYGTAHHGQPIVGTIVLMKEALNEDGELDLEGLTESESSELAMHILRAKASPLPEEPKGPLPRPKIIPLPPDADLGDFLDRLFGSAEPDAESMM